MAVKGWGRVTLPSEVKGRKSVSKGREEVSRRGQAAPTSHPGTQSMVSNGIDSKLIAILRLFGRSDLEVGPDTPKVRPPPSHCTGVNINGCDPSDRGPILQNLVVKTGRPRSDGLRTPHFAREW